jgi:hypothetical protein
MKHIGKVSVIRRQTRAYTMGTDPGFADAKIDFLNAIWKAWSDFIVAKKNEIGIG